MWPNGVRKLIRQGHRSITLCRWSVPRGFSCATKSVKNPCNAGDLGLIPGLGTSPGEGNSNPLQFSCLENPMNRGAWWATVHAVSRVRHDLATKPPPRPTNACPSDREVKNKKNERIILKNWISMYWTANLCHLCNFLSLWFHLISLCLGKIGIIKIVRNIK